MSARLSAAALEQALGDPGLPGPLSRESVVAYDEAEAFPSEAWTVLRDVRFFDALTPDDESTALPALDRALALGRVVARRDATTAYGALSSVLASLPVFAAGDATQRAWVTARLRAGDVGALALAEEAHGADLVATQTIARATESGYAIDGTKWAINNATRSAFVTTLARHGDGGLALFLVDKARAKDACVATPKLRTHGVRGADVSGLRFFGFPVPASMRIGGADDGLPLVRATMMVSRTMSSVVALGAADTALRHAFDFAERRGRGVDGAPVSALPSVRTDLRRAFVDLLLADALAIFAARGLSFMPEQMHVLSAVTRVAIATRCTRAVARSAEVLGARGYLRSGRYALFQKLARDVALVTLLDGSQGLHRALVADDLGLRIGARLDEGGRARLARCASLDEPAPRFSASRLLVRDASTDDVLAGLDAATAVLAETASSGACLRLDALALAHASLVEDARATRASAPTSGAAQRLAERYVSLVTGAVLVHVHAARTKRTEDDDALLTLALDTVLRELDLHHVHKDDATCAARVDALLRRASHTRVLYSHAGFTLAESLGTAP